MDLSSSTFGTGRLRQGAATKERASLVGLIASLFVAATHQGVVAQAVPVGAAYATATDDQGGYVSNLSPADLAVRLDTLLRRA